MAHCAELFAQEADPDWNPVTYNQICESQKHDSHLKKLLRLDNCCLTQNTFHRGGKPYQLWTFKNKIYIPQEMQHKVVHWYHNRLLHPGHTRTEATIGQHFWWPKMRDQIRKHAKICPTCQKTKEKMYMAIFLSRKQ